MAWRLAAFGLGGLAVLSYLLPRPVPGALVFVPVQLLAFGVLIAAVRWKPPEPARAWQIIAVGFGLIAASLVLVGLGLATIGELVLNPVRLAGYGLVVYGGIQVTRPGRAEGHGADTLESLIIATATATVGWFLLVEPTGTGSGDDASAACQANPRRHGTLFAQRGSRLGQVPARGVTARPCASSRPHGGGLPRIPALGGSE